MAKMKLYAPGYYKKFSCIADKCTHSCCIGWEIDIDSDTMAKYASINDGYGKQIRDSIDATDTPHFRLTEGERCPHLDQRGLCRIISNLGEAYLCHICREHPRFYNDTSRGREVGLGMACEEACRIILESDEYDRMIEIDEIDGDVESTDFDAVACRDAVYGILADNTIPYAEKLSRIQKEHGVRPDMLSDETWREFLSSLEYLDASHRELFAHYSSDLLTPPEWEKRLTRALAYFIYRHGSSARDSEEFRTAVGLSLFCERLLASVIKAECAQEKEDVCRLARIISEEIEYSEENTEAIRFEFSFEMEG